VSKLTHNQHKKISNLQIHNDLLDNNATNADNQLRKSNCQLGFLLDFYNSTERDVAFVWGVAGPIENTDLSEYQPGFQGEERLVLMFDLSVFLCR